MTTITNGTREVTIRKPDTDGRVLVMFDDIQRHKTYANEKTAERAVQKYLNS